MEIIDGRDQKDPSHHVLSSSNIHQHPSVLPRTLSLLQAWEMGHGERQKGGWEDPSRWSNSPITHMDFLPPHLYLFTFSKGPDIPG